MRKQKSLVALIDYYKSGIAYRDKFGGYSPRGKEIRVTTNEILWLETQGKIKFATYGAYPEKLTLMHIFLNENGTGVESLGLGVNELELKLKKMSEVKEFRKKREESKADFVLRILNDAKNYVFNTHHATSPTTFTTECKQNTSVVEFFKYDLNKPVQVRYYSR
jgi:hypothetical protein